MPASAFHATLAAAALAAAGAASAATLDDVRAAGILRCGVSTGLAGFAAPDANNDWQGFDVAFCRAVAAAVLGDSSKVQFVPVTPQTRFAALAAGEVDLLSRHTTWTFSRDAEMKLTFAGVSYYDGQGFLLRKELGLSSARELDGTTICVEAGTTSELNLADYFRVNGMSYEPLPVETNAEAQQQYLAGACDVYSGAASALAATRATFADPENHILLPEIISKEPLGPVVRHGDDEWADIVRWTLFAMIAAEEYGITSANVEQLAKGTANPEINRMLGTEGDLGSMLRLSPDWARNIIMMVGNYGEVFNSTIGEATPIGLPRGLNALWTQGGLLYAPPFR